MTLSYDEIKAKHYARNGDGGKPYKGAIVRMFMAELPVKNPAPGKARSNFIPSISIQYPGMDETVRKIQPEDIAAYPELYAALQAAEGGEIEEVMDGLSLQLWPPIHRSVVQELRALGFRTVEQLAEANDAVKRKMGPLVQWVKKAKEWVAAGESDQALVAQLRADNERLIAKNKSLAEQLELAHQRIDAIEGTDLSGQNEKATAAPKGRKKKVEEPDDE